MTNGHRHDVNTQTGATTIDETYPDRDGTTFSPSLGLVWSAHDNTRVRASVYRAFRLPTLNEFYRPFRVGDVTTLANPELVPETLDGVDGGISTKWANWDFSLGAFFNQLNDSVSNITLSTGPDGTTRQRRNLEEVHLRGIEARAGLRFSETISASVSYLYSDARVRKSPEAPGLVGNRLPQVPQHTATIDAQWQATGALRFNATARAFSGQYEDDANTLKLAAAMTFDLRASYVLTENIDCWITAENIFDADVETSKKTGGLTTFGPGRFVRAGLGAHW
jgi:outer membrane receptor protein involved in Fe transport